MHRSSPARLLATLALSLMLAVAAGTAARAQSPDEITAVMDRWAATYGSASSGAEMLPLYHPDAVFFGTAFQEPFVGAAEFEPYFQQQFDNFPNRTVRFVDTVIKIIDPGVATATGHYQFNVETADGRNLEALYRVTLAFARDGDNWVIVQHHSSQMPQ